MSFRSLVSLAWKWERCKWLVFSAYSLGKSSSYLRNPLTVDVISYAYLWAAYESRESVLMLNSVELFAISKPSRLESESRRFHFEPSICRSSKTSLKTKKSKCDRVNYQRDIPCGRYTSHNGTDGVWGIIDTGSCARCFPELRLIFAFCLLSYQLIS